MPVGGAVYGFSTYEVNHNSAGQLNLTVTFLLPLMVYLVLLWRDRSITSRTFVGLLALAMMAQFYLCLELFADMTAVGAVALALGYAVASRDNRPAVISLSRLVGLAYLIAGVLLTPYIAYALATMPPGFTRSPAVSEVHLACW